MSLLKELRDLTLTAFRNSSLKGVPRIFKSKEKFLIVMWFVSVVVLFSVATVQVNELLLHYTTYPTVIEVEDVSRYGGDTGDLMHRESLNFFPAVTICNLSPIKPEVSGMKTLEEYDMELQEAKEQASTLADQHFGPGDPLEYLRSVRGYYQNIKLSEVKRAGHSLDSFLVNCFYVSGIASSKNLCEDSALIRQFTSPKLFNCYTIELTNNDLAPYEIVFTLFLDDFMTTPIPVFNMWNTFGQDLGARIVIHPVNTVPDLDSGVNLSPGFRTTIHSQLQIRHRLPSPHGDCIQSYPRTIFNTEGDRMNYTTFGCISACFHQFSKENCSCINSDTLARWDIGNGSTTNCGKLHKNISQTLETLGCGLRARARANKRCLDPCPPGCTEVEYVNTMSSSVWPKTSRHLAFFENIIKPKSYAWKFASLYEEIIAEQKQGDSKKADQMLRDSYLISGNFLQVSIVLDPQAKVLSDRPKYSYADVTAKAASILNLYSGITAILVVELLDFVIRFVVLLYNKIHKGLFEVNQVPATIGKANESL